MIYVFKILNIGGTEVHRVELLRAGYYFVRRCGEDEVYVTCCVGLQCLGHVQYSESDFLVPVSVGVVVAAGVEDAVGDGVVADFFAVSVTKD